MRCRQDRVATGDGWAARARLAPACLADLKNFNLKLEAGMQQRRALGPYRSALANHDYDAPLKSSDFPGQEPKVEDRKRMPMRISLQQPVAFPINLGATTRDDSH